MKKYAILIILSLLVFVPIKNAYAQQTTIELKKASNQFSASGSVIITKNGSQFNYTASAKDLPATLPANGVYYILWALTPENKADNLGPLTNSTENSGSLAVSVKQFFVTSEKERFPEFVSGPRIMQSATIASSVFTGIAAATPNVTPKQTATTAIASPRQASSPPIGGPVGAPETGLGGAIIWNGMIYSLGAIGLSGLTLSLYNKLKKK